MVLGAQSSSKLRLIIGVYKELLVGELVDNSQCARSSLFIQKADNAINNI